MPDLLSLCPDARVYKHTRERSRGGQTGIDDGDVFGVEGAKLRAWWCPGHTEDHVVFVLEDDGEGAGGEGSMSLFTGDNVLGHGTAVFEDLGKGTSLVDALQGTDPDYARECLTLHAQAASCKFWQQRT